MPRLSNKFIILYFQTNFSKFRHLNVKKFKFDYIIIQNFAPRALLN